MKAKVNSLLSRLVNFDYVSAWVVLVIDVLLSLSASILALVMVTWIFGASIIYHNILHILLLCTFSSLLAFYLFKTYRKAVRHATIVDIVMLFLASLIKVLIAYPLAYLIAPSTQLELTFQRTQFNIVCASTDLLLSFILLASSRCAMVIAYRSVKSYLRETNNLKKVLVYGTSEKSLSLVTRLFKSPHFAIMGFIEYGKDHRTILVEDKKLFYFKDENRFLSIVESLSIDAVIFSSVLEMKSENERLVKYAISNNVSVLIAPEIDQVSQFGVGGSSNVRKINIEDLLGRPEIKINVNKIKEDFRGKTILVTGAAGSIGSQLVRQLSSFHVGNIILYDNAETPMHILRLELEQNYPSLNFVPVIGDVRYSERLDYVFRNWHPQIVFHAAAYKHVPLMEENPCEAVLVNVIGTRNVAEKCVEYGAEKMVMISTDKAVNPTNVMGCTKRLAEMYVQSIGELSGENFKTQFITTRFGNVLGSNGSVIPLFKQQIEKGGPVTVTHPEITRFFMTIPEACRLVMEAACMGMNNQIFVFDMGESVKIVDLARRMIELSGFVPDKDIKIVYSGLRPGEKLYEEVLANAENTLPTTHDRILKAKVRDVSYTQMKEIVDRLFSLSSDVKIPEIIKYMKQVVPEYISQNSKFCEYDAKK